MNTAIKHPMQYGNSGLQRVKHNAHHTDLLYNAITPVHIVHRQCYWPTFLLYDTTLHSTTVPTCCTTNPCSGVWP